jgi:serine/threonine protein kinase
MVAIEPDNRYTASEALQHPWITRRYDDEIPLSLNDKILLFDKT